MTKKNTTKKTDVVADNTPATDVEVSVPSKEEAKAKEELVMEAKINLTDDKKSEDVKPTPAEEEKKAPKAEKAYSSSVTVMNKSQNNICLFASTECQLTIGPREIKKVSKDLLNELLKNKMVRRFFDKGVLSHNLDEGSNVVSAHDAVAPEHLTQAVERHEGGNNVVAEVKKFEKDGSLNIDLG